MKIGDVVRRVKAGAKWHLVESVVAEAAVTKCGRRMERVTVVDQTPLEVDEPAPAASPDDCVRCFPQ